MVLEDFSRLANTSGSRLAEKVRAMVVGQVESSGSVRSIGRGLEVLQAVNQHRSLSMTSIASICGLPYATACRVVDTLISAQMIEREQTKKHSRPTALVRTLSAGYQPDDDLVAASRPHIERLTRDMRWPISVSTRVGMSMMIRESTHAIASYTLSLYHPGYTMPILGSSGGKVQLSFSSMVDREAVLAPLREHNDVAAARIFTRLEAELEVVRTQGFASFDRIRHTANPGKTSAISVPVLIDGLC